MIIVYVEPLAGTISERIKYELGTTYYCRLSGLDGNNIQKTPYSNAMSETAQ